MGSEMCIRDRALRIFISTLEEEPLDNRQKELLGKISASADNLNNLLDNLLDISKLDSEGFEACLGNFDISDLLKNIFFEFAEIPFCQSADDSTCRNTAAGHRGYFVDMFFKSQLY